MIFTPTKGFESNDKVQICEAPRLLGSLIDLKPSKTCHSRNQPTTLCSFFARGFVTELMKTQISPNMLKKKEKKKGEMRPNEPECDAFDTSSFPWPHWPELQCLVLLAHRTVLCLGCK